jgi:hypothetical protein
VHSLWRKCRIFLILSMVIYLVTTQNLKGQTMHSFVNNPYEYYLVFQRENLNSTKEILFGRPNQNWYDKLRAPSVKARMSHAIRNRCSISTQTSEGQLCQFFAQRFVIDILSSSNIAGKSRIRSRHSPCQPHRRKSRWLWMKFCWYFLFK